MYIQNNLLWPLLGGLRLCRLLLLLLLISTIGWLHVLLRLLLTGHCTATIHSLWLKTQYMVHAQDVAKHRALYTKKRSCCMQACVYAASYGLANLNKDH